MSLLSDVRRVLNAAAIAGADANKAAELLIKEAVEGAQESQRESLDLGEAADAAAGGADFLSALGATLDIDPGAGLDGADGEESADILRAAAKSAERSLREEGGIAALAGACKEMGALLLESGIDPLDTNAELPCGKARSIPLS